MRTQEKIDLIANTDPFELIDKIRVQTIEECAQDVEWFIDNVLGRGNDNMFRNYLRIVARIRALKDKP